MIPSFCPLIGGGKEKKERDSGEDDLQTDEGSSWFPRGKKKGGEEPAKGLGRIKGEGLHGCKL